jgi:hypothetical protein
MVSWARELRALSKYGASPLRVAVDLALRLAQHKNAVGQRRQNTIMMGLHLPETVPKL